MIQFTVSSLEAELTKHGVLDICLGSKQHYLRIQRNQKGHGTFGDIHFECDGQGWGGYDVIKSIKIAAGVVRISLIPEQAEDFQGRFEYEIALALDETQIQKAVAFLERLFKGTDLLSIER
jgi:hypothetical protein